MGIRYCNIPFCANFHGFTDPNIRLFRPPKGSKLEDRWMEIIRANLSGEHQTISPIGLKICSLHFDMDNIKRKCRLDPGTIPTIFPEVNTDQPVEQKSTQTACLIRVEPEVELVQTQRSTVQPTVERETEACQNCSQEEETNQALHNQLDQINETIKQKQLTVTGLRDELDKLWNRWRTFEAVTQCVVCNKQVKPNERFLHKCLRDWERLFCAYCPLSFNSAPYLSQHLKTKHPQLSESVRCDECAVTFDMQLLYDLHSEACHRAKEPELVVRRIKCQICSVRVDETEFAAHSCITPDKLSCEHCSASFETLHAFCDHLENGHVEKRQYKCEVCKCIFAAHILLDEHSKAHLNSTFTCDICSKKYATKAKLFVHISGVHIEKAAPKFLCHLCGVTKQNAAYLMRHMQIHEAPQYKCPKCGRKFHLQSSLRSHMARHVDPSSAQSYQCHICNKNFSAKRKLRKHVRDAHIRTKEDRRFACGLCSVKFFKRCRLQKHLQTVHTTDRVHQCTHCNKSYKHLGDLNKHLRTHLGDKMYKCSQCTEAFRLPMELDSHLLKHDEERYKASGCI